MPVNLWRSMVIRGSGEPQTGIRKKRKLADAGNQGKEVAHMRKEPENPMLIHVPEDLKPQNVDVLELDSVLRRMYGRTD